MKIVNDNIMNIKEGIIAHQVNCRDRIGAGVSGAIIKKYPIVEQEYHKFCAERKPIDRFDNTQLIPVTDDLTIANLFTQFNYGNASKTGCQYTDTSRLAKHIRKLCTDNPDKTIYIPYNIGCGLAGGKWDQLYVLIRNIPNLIAVKL